jgi:hypothetical protein
MHIAHLYRPNLFVSSCASEGVALATAMEARDNRILLVLRYCTACCILLSYVVVSTSMHIAWLQKQYFDGSICGLFVN